MKSSPTTFRLSKFIEYPLDEIPSICVTCEGVKENHRFAQFSLAQKYVLGKSENIFYIHPKVDSSWYQDIKITWKNQFFKIVRLNAIKEKFSKIFRVFYFLHENAIWTHSSHNIFNDKKSVRNPPLRIKLLKTNNKRRWAADAVVSSSHANSVTFHFSLSSFHSLFIAVLAPHTKKMKIWVFLPFKTNKQSQHHKLFDTLNTNVVG